jgi:hypothetical protein
MDAASPDAAQLPLPDAAFAVDAQPLPDAASAVDAAIASPDASSTADGSTPACTGPITLELGVGNGMIVLAADWSNAEMSVIVMCGGAPRADVPVEWTVVQGTGELGNAPDAQTIAGPAQMLTVSSDMNGVSAVSFRNPSSWGSSSASNQQNLIHASAGGAVIELKATVFNPGIQGNTPLPLVYVTKPTDLDFGSGRVGTIIPDALEVQVFNAAGDQMNHPVADIGVVVFDPNDPTRRIAWCVGPGDTALTGPDGIAHCDLQLGTMPLNGRYLRVAVGSALYWDGYNIEVTP